MEILLSTLLLLVVVVVVLTLVVVVVQGDFYLIIQIFLHQKYNLHFQYLLVPIQ
jgi:hypothetical protein